MFNRILKITVSLILVAVIMMIVGIERLIDNLSRVNGFIAFLALCLCPFIVMLGTEKWRQMIKHEARNIKYRDALISFLGGMALGLVTPARVGELGRIAFIKEGRKAVLAGIAVIDRLVDLEVTLLLAVVGAWYFFGYQGGIVILTITAAGATIIFMPHTYYLLIKKIIKVMPFRQKIEEMMVGAAGVPFTALGACMFLRVLVSLVDLFQFYILINAFVPVSILPVFVVYPVIIIINIVPITFMGIGMREGVAMLTLSKFGVPPEASVSASFLLFCLNTLLPGLIGTLFVSRIELVNRRVKSEQPETAAFK